MTRFRIVELRRGTARPFGPNGELSAIDKQPVPGPVQVSATGMEGDEQGDPRHHGGPDKALHAYSVAHYPWWQGELPRVAERFRPGAFGENLVVEGVTESDLCLGDLWQVGEVTLQLSQSRQPCWKLNTRFATTDMARRVQDSGRTGWYFRVLTPGELRAPAEARLIERPHPDWPLTRIWDVLYRDTLNTVALRELATLTGLPERWQSLAQNRLKRREVEDWSRRLNAPESG